MSDHARLSPSNKRWPHCPGSVREEAAYPDIAGDAAIDGTGSHILLELCLNNNVEAIHYDQLIIGSNHEDRPNGWLVNAERCKRVQICLDYVERRVNELKRQFPGCQVNINSESRSDPGKAYGRDDWWGTCDITITAVDPEIGIVFLEVVDYKDGRGYVSEKFNTQLISYLYGKLQTWLVKDGLKGIRMTIVQPKTNMPIRYQCSTNPDHGISMSVLKQEADKLAVAATKTDDPDARLVPGPWCQWCKHNPKRGGTCTAQTDKSMEVISNMTTDIAVQGNDGLLEFINRAVSDVRTMTPEQLAKVADAEDGFKAAFDKVREEIQHRIESGDSVPGYAMIPGKASRVWAESEEVIVKKLKAKRLKKDQIFPAKLITPAAALKLSDLSDAQKKKIENDLISTVAGKMKLSKVSYDHQEPKDVDQMFMSAGESNEDTEQTETVSFF